MVKMPGSVFDQASSVGTPVTAIAQVLRYGPANLQLEITKTYIGKMLLESAAVVRWLAKTHSEYLQQLQFIAEIKQLPSQ